MALPAILAAFLMLLTTREPERGATEDALKVRAGPEQYFCISALKPLFVYT